MGRNEDEPTANLLAAARMRLQEALETAEQGGWWRRVTFDPGNWLRQVRFSPALAAVILIAGFAGGVGTAYRVMEPVGFNAASGAGSGASVETEGSAGEASITGIRSITQAAGSQQIDITYDTVLTQQAEGSLNDRRIQQLLLFAAQNNYNAGVRLDSVDLLTQRPQVAAVRDALVYALRYDSNPGVRLKALDGLRSFVKDDVRVRNAMLEALVNDANPGVRTEALRLIDPVKADGSVRGVLMTLAAEDESAYIKSQARTMLAQLPEIE